MKQLIMIIVAAFTAAAVFAQTRERREIGLQWVAESPAAVTAGNRQGAAMTRPSREEHTAGTEFAQSPGVVQINFRGEDRASWFVTTETIPVGSAISYSLWLPDRDALAFGEMRLKEDLPAGTSLVLPSIRRLGDFWPQGLTTYAVVVTLAGGKKTHNASDFSVGYFRERQDVEKMVPLIGSATETVKDGNVILTIRGAFVANERPQIVLEDTVVPSGAIVSFTAGEITVNLSKVPGMRPEILQEPLLTVGQDGWSDTYVFRRVPLRPGTYNPAPPLP